MKCPGWLRDGRETLAMALLRRASTLRWMFRACEQSSGQPNRRCLGIRAHGWLDIRQQVGSGKDRAEAPWSEDLTPDMAGRGCPYGS